MSYGDDEVSRGLKRHLAGEYTVEDMLDVAADSGHPEAVREALDQYTDEVARQFLQGNPDYLPTNENLEKIIQELRHQAGFGMVNLDEADIDDEVFTLAQAGVWTLEYLTAAKNKLLKMGALEVPAGTLRELTPAQTLQCQRAAVADPNTSVIYYLLFSTGQNPQTRQPGDLDQEAVSYVDGSALPGCGEPGVPPRFHQPSTVRL